MNALIELDELHKRKAKLLLETTATINIAQQTIARSIKLSKEVKEILNNHNDFPGDSGTEQQSYGTSKSKGNLS